MIGPRYWSTGITLSPFGEHSWTVTLSFTDDGFCDQRSTQGKLECRYVVADNLYANATLRSDLEVAFDTLVNDAARMGIEWLNVVGMGGPTVYVEHDGEFPGEDRPDLRRFANRMAARHGWQPAYRRELLPDEVEA